jgi:hypothetical protein
MKFDKKRIFSSFTMPMILLAIRIHVEIIFKNSYPKFLLSDENA